MVQSQIHAGVFVGRSKKATVNLANGNLELAVYFEANDVGGVTAVTRTLLDAKPADTSVVVICPNNSEIRKWAEDTTSRKVSFVFTALKNRWDFLGWLHFVNIIRNLRIIRKAKVLHCHLHTPFSCLPIIILAGMFTKARIVTTEHYISQLKYLRRRPLSPLKSLIREARIRFQLFMKLLSFRFIHTIVTVSESNRDFMISEFGQQIEPKLRAIPNGINLTEYLAPANQQERAVQDKDSDLTVVTVAGLNNQKGHEYLVRAIPSIVAEFAQVRFVFVGEGHLRSSLENLATSLGIENKVEFAGWRTDVPAILRRSDLFVLPSLFEGLPLSLIEAMASGKAVVATDVDGTHDVVIDGATGFLVPPKDPAALSQRIAELLADSKMRERFGQAGKERVFASFSDSRMTREYSELYESALA